MTVSTAQYVDLLVKKIEGVAKTDTAANKSPSNESIPSPLLNRGDTCWTQAYLIPGVAAQTAGIVQAYGGVDAVECTADTTTVPVGGVYPTWLTNLTDWIPQEFGATYFIKAYVDNAGAANPQVTGTQIFDSGTGGTGEWFFDYQAGLLNFIGQTIPTVLTSTKRVYIVGYRYVGLTGVQNLGNITVGNIFTDGYYYANGTPFSGGGGNGGGTGNAIINGTSNVSIPVANGNVTIATVGTHLWTFDNTGNVTIPGVLTVNGSQAFWAYSNTGLTVTANVTSDNSGVSMEDGGAAVMYAATDATISANSVGTTTNWTFGADRSLTCPASSNIVMSGGGSQIRTAGTIAAEGNVATESWLVANNMGVDAYELRVAGPANLGLVGNITITGGNAGEAIVTDGNGSLSWANVATNTGNISFSGSNITTADNSISLVTGNTAWTYSSSGVATAPVGTDPGGVPSQQFVSGTVTTIEGAVNANVVGNSAITVWTASSANIVGGSMRLCVQSYSAGNVHYNTELMEVSFGKQMTAPFNAFYVVSDRVQTNVAAESANVMVALNGNNALCLIASVNDGNSHFFTHSTVTFDNTLPG